MVPLGSSVDDGCSVVVGGVDTTELEVDADDEVSTSPESLDAVDDGDSLELASVVVELGSLVELDDESSSVDEGALVVLVVVVGSLSLVDPVVVDSVSDEVVVGELVVVVVVVFGFGFLVVLVLGFVL